MNKEARIKKLINIWKSISEIPDEIWDLYIDSLSQERRGTEFNDKERYIFLYLKKQKSLDKRYKIKYLEDITCGSSGGNYRVCLYECKIHNYDRKHNHNDRRCFYIHDALDKPFNKKIAKEIYDLLVEIDKNITE